LPFQKTAVYALDVESTPTSVTVYRNLLIGDIVFPVNQFPELRAFYNKFETKDQEPIVLKVATQSAGGS
jgi:hypothetical protein